MKIAMLSKEYPPHVYGGAGVHVEYLARELARLEGVEVLVRFFGAGRTRDGRLGAEGLEGRPGLKRSPVIDAIERSAAMLESLAGATVVHTHTWYVALAGFLARRAFSAPHVLTVHSLEPLRPWKKDQLGGGGYELSSWIEKTAIEAADAVVAVSRETEKDILRCYPAVARERVHVIHNGIDPEEFSPRADPEALRRRGVDPTRPYVLFVGRATAQKGIDHFVDAAAFFEPRAQVVLLAGAADTPEFGAAIAARIEGLRARRRGVVLVEEMVSRKELVAFQSAAAVYVCPSVYEPFGIVNLEAMACGAPVVASRTGGIPEIVVEGETGLLVPPADPQALAAAVNDLLANPARAREMGARGRARVVERFTWAGVARRTRDLYASLARTT